MPQIRTALAVAVTAAAVGVFGATLVHAFFWAPESEVAPPPQVAAAAPSRTVSPDDYPVRLIIPSLGINAHIQKVGIAASGSMAVPSNFTDVAWYKYGPVPGQAGSAVIDGHVDNGLSLAGVFKHLNEIKPGDSVYVETQKGDMLHFTVAEVDSYPYKSVPTAQIFNQTDASRLNLITCDGGWVAGERTYDHRFVVYTTLTS